MPERDGSESPPESSGRGVPEWKADSKTESETGIDGSAVDHGGVSPPEAFSMLANETRIEILQALWERRDEPVAFSELHADVDVDRGNFNYHLSKLAEHFVRQTQAGYELREAGKAVIRAVLAGTITHDPRIEPTDLGVPCPLCGGAIEFSYADEFITVRCTSCAGVMGGDVPSGTFMHHTFPPAGLQGRHGIEVLEAARVHYEADLVTMLQGVCPECGGTVDRSIHVCAEHETDSDGMCTACGPSPTSGSNTFVPTAHTVDGVSSGCRYCFTRQSSPSSMSGSPSKASLSYGGSFGSIQGTSTESNAPSSRRLPSR